MQPPAIVGSESTHLSSFMYPFHMRNHKENMAAVLALARRTLALGRRVLTGHPELAVAMEEDPLLVANAWPFSSQQISLLVVANADDGCNKK